MWTSLLTAIAAIPELISSIKQLLAYFQKVEQEKWFAKNDEAFDSLKKAKTPEEILNAAKAVQDLISKL